jgi:hypothetical protein
MAAWSCNEFIMVTPPSPEYHDYNSPEIFINTGCSGAISGCSQEDLQRNPQVIKIEAFYITSTYVNVLSYLCTFL